MEAYLREKGMEPALARALAAREPAPLRAGAASQGLACKPGNAPRADGACPRPDMTAYRLPDGGACCMQNEKISEAMRQSKEYQARKPFYDGLLQARKLLKLEGKIRRYGRRVCQRAPPYTGGAPAAEGDSEYNKYLRKYRRAAAKIRAIRQWFSDPSRVSDDLGGMCQFLQLHSEEVDIRAQLRAKTAKILEFEEMDRAARVSARAGAAAPRGEARRTPTTLSRRAGWRRGARGTATPRPRPS